MLFFAPILPVLLGLRCSRCCSCFCCQWLLGFGVFSSIAEARPALLSYLAFAALPSCYAKCKCCWQRPRLLVETCDCGLCCNSHKSACCRSPGPYLQSRLNLPSLNLALAASRWSAFVRLCFCCLFTPAVWPRAAETTRQHRQLELETFLQLPGTEPLWSRGRFYEGGPRGPRGARHLYLLLWSSCCWKGVNDPRPKNPDRTRGPAAPHRVEECRTKTKTNQKKVRTG